jgi:hypothetical protein
LNPEPAGDFAKISVQRLDFLKPIQKLRVSLRVSGLAHAEGLQIPSWNFHRVSQRETRPRLAHRESDELFAMEKFSGV